jgi:hypothetical protein
MKEKYDDDLKLKRELEELAKSSDLDSALVALWDKVRLKKSGILDISQELKFEEFSGGGSYKNSYVEFKVNDYVYKIEEKRSSYNYDDNLYSELSFYENGDLVFAVDCSLTDTDYGYLYKPFTITSFKKRGNWARMLLEFYKMIRVNTVKRDVGLGYYNANEIKDRFQK